MTTFQPDGYFAPDSQNQGAPILVLHAWWGLNKEVKAFCDRLSAAGFTVFAPDLYHGQIAETIPAAESLATSLDMAAAMTSIAEAARFLKNDRPEAQAISVIGFSLGAFFALDLSITAPEDVRSVVVFYGTRPEADFSPARARYLGHFAESDPFETQELVDQLEADLRAAGRDVSFHQYPGTGHWFFEADRTDAYDAAAAKLAWERTLAFLGQDIH